MNFIINHFSGTFEGKHLPTWMIQEHFPQNSKVVGWIHSHVNGSKCFFSGLDVHTQFRLQSMDEHFFGIVFQIHTDGFNWKLECYKLTELGMTTVANCSMIGQHKSCQRKTFYECIFEFWH